MNDIVVKTRKNRETQSKTLIIAPNGNNVSLKLVLEYKSSIGKWLMSVFDANTSQCYVTNIPVINSNKFVNDLMMQFRYLNIGAACLFSIEEQMRKIMPRLDNFDQYYLIWGDTHV